ncbi:MAG: AI-2E family transporter [Chthoniobacterales bacterium]
MSFDDSPTPFQRKICWAGLTSLAALAVISVILVAGWSVVSLCAYLKPVLTPIAIAAVLAYLLTPVVGLLCRWKLPRTWAVVVVFVLFSAGLALIGITVGPALAHQGSIFASKIPSYSQKITALAKGSAGEIQRLSDLKAQTTVSRSLLEDLSPENLKLHAIGYANDTLDWAQKELPAIATATGTFLQKSIGGVFGVLGFLLSLILVPVFLFFFLLESPSIGSNWSRYLPLRASPLKEEIVSLLNEINTYLIHFFRGQLLVSLIDGAVVGISLFLFLRLDFSFLIGLMVGILCLIPYLGMALCLIPAMLIAVAQYGDVMHPVWVLVIFALAHNLDGIFISPKVIGESVGLHPMTVIISVFAWTIILGGLLGALLAVPLTATIKVVLRRYFWDRPVPQPVQQTLKIEESIEKKTVAVELPL